MIAFSEDLLKVAILGTDYSPLSTTPAAQCIDSAANSEKRFWQTITFQILSQSAGTVSKTFSPTIVPASPETLPALPEAFQSLVQRFLNEKKVRYFELALYLAALENKIFSGEMVLALLEEALVRKDLRIQLQNLCGALGVWLASLREDWQVLYRSPPTLQDFENASNKERLEIFLYFRQQQSAIAKIIVDQEFSKASAALRLNFLEVIQQTLQPMDSEFLASCLEDKSQKVQALAVFLLSTLQYPTFLNAAADFVYKNLLVSKQKTKYDFTFAAPLPEVLRRLGIQETSSQKGISDALFWLYQLLPWLNPEDLTKHFGQEIVSALLEHDFLLPALEKTALNFKNKALAETLLTEKSGTLHLLSLFSAEEKNMFLKKASLKHLRSEIAWLYPLDFTPLPESWLEIIFQWAEKDVFFHSRQDVENFVIHISKSHLRQWQQQAKAIRQKNQEQFDWAMRQQWKFLTEELDSMMQLYRALFTS